MQTVRRRCVVLVVAVSLVTSTGCAGTRWNSLAWFPVLGGNGARASAGMTAGASAAPNAPRPDEVKQVAPESGIYKVKFATRAGADQDDLHTFGGARRILHEGDFLGFTRDATGQIYAIAGDEKFPLHRRASASRKPAYLVWSYKTLDRETNDVGEFLAGVGEALLAVGLVVGTVALWLWSASQDRECGGEYDE